MSEPLAIGTRVQQLGDDCEAGYLSYGKIFEVNNGPFRKGYIYNIQLDNGSMSYDVLRSEMRLETDPPFPHGPFDVVLKGFEVAELPFQAIKIPKTPLTQYSTEELQGELNKRKI